MTLQLFIFMCDNAAADPKRILCCFRVVVLLLLASCLFLVFSSKSLGGFLGFSCWSRRETVEHIIDGSSPQAVEEIVDRTIEQIIDVCRPLAVKTIF